MSKKFYIADWHYGHANIMAYDNRPFTWVDDMNKALVERWNRVVSPGDIVYVGRYVLGSVCRVDACARQPAWAKVLDKR